MGMQKKYYTVVRGRQPGIYPAWYGPGGAEEQVRGYPGAVFKGFGTLREAEQWLRNPVAGPPERSERRPLAGDGGALPGQVVIYTDGSSVGNPGPGGYGVVILAGETRKEISGGYRWTTNNRMELMACIAALGTLKEPADVILHSDSRYVVNGIDRGWALKWRANGWMRTKSEAARNCDLWERLLELCDRHRVRFVWVHGHAGNRENERCDRLATDAAKRPDLPEDRPYVDGLGGEQGCPPR